MEQFLFLTQLEWMRATGVHFGVQHIVYRGKIYWTDDVQQMQDLYESFRAYCETKNTAEVKN